MAVRRLAPRRGISLDAVNSIVFWSLIGAIVGARVAYVIAHASDFASPLEWLYVWKGGISLLGGIAGRTIANAVNIRRFGLRFFQVADALTAPPRPRDRDRTDRRPDHRRPPRQTDVLAARVDLPRLDRSAPRSSATGRAVKPTPREPHRDHQAAAAPSSTPGSRRSRRVSACIRRRCTTC
jgi:hypothetical protein